MTDRRYYHTVRGKRRLCHLWLPPNSDAYWHMCGDPEDVAALSIPTHGGVVELAVKGRDHAYRIEAFMKELKERARHGMITRRDFEETEDLHLLLADLGVDSAKEAAAMMGYAEGQVYKFAGPRGGRPKPVRPMQRRPVRVQDYTRRRSIVDRFGHRVRVKEWPSEAGLSTMRRHYKRAHPRVFRASIRKGVATRARQRRA